MTETPQTIKNPTGKIQVDAISDVMCPWCYIGKKNLDAAVAQLPDLDIEIAWRPFQLDPTLPKEGKDREQYLNEKFGGETGARQIYDQINRAGKAVGIDFDFQAIAVSPNTLDAHRVIRWAGGQDEETQQKLVRRLFEVFFEEGGNVGDDEVLAKAAEDAGLDGQIVRDLLKTDDDKKQVQVEIAQAQKIGVTGVPFFLINRKYGVPGAVPVEKLVEALETVAGMGE